MAETPAVPSNRPTVDNPPMTPRLLRWLPLAGILVVAALAEASAQTPSIVVRADGRLDVSAPPAPAP